MSKLIVAGILSALLLATTPVLGRGGVRPGLVEAERGVGPERHQWRPRPPAPGKGTHGTGFTARSTMSVARMTFQ